LDAPVMIKYEDSLRNLEKVPFPAVTINNELKMETSYSIAMNTYDIFYQPTYEEIIEIYGEKFVLSMISS
jgi:hypothetical protein